jgi:ABC-2 type transport system ATP-binding protein
VLITAEGPAAEIKDRLERVSGVNKAELRETVDGRVSFEVHADKGKDVRAELARAIVEAGWRLFELKTSGLSLEDIFLKLTTEDVASA